jgi:hypothetical protein
LTIPDKPNFLKKHFHQNLSKLSKSCFKAPTKNFCLDPKIYPIILLLPSFLIPSSFINQKKKPTSPKPDTGFPRNALKILATIRITTSSTPPSISGNPHPI